MNGHTPDSNSLEMKAMNAYIRWVGKEVGKGKKPKGTGLEQLPFLERAADPIRGKMVYVQKCRTCHGANGEGQPNSMGGYQYPPLWGDHSYNTSAGIYRLTKFAGFIKDNMPYGSDYLNEHLSNEEAWDLAAFVNSQPRPVRKFKRDWPDISAKPADIPEGPFADSLPVSQHKYGPFTPITRFKKDRTMSTK
jgi:thiosulfate dehydrogenase